MRTVLTQLSLTVLLAACSSSSSAGGGAQPATDAGTDAPSAPVSPFAVWIYDRSPGTTPTPIGGAIVAFDPEGGDRVEVTTGDDGKAVFDAALVKTTATVTVAAPDHVVYTQFDVDPHAPPGGTLQFMGKASTDLVIALPGKIASRTVKLSGNVLDKTNAGDRVNLGPSVNGTLWDDVTSTYELRAPKGQPFFLLGSEYTFSQTGREAQATIGKFFRVDHVALTADATLDVDVAAATPVTTTTNHIHLVIPGGDAGPLGGTSSGRVNVLDVYGVMFPGVVEQAKVSADKNGFDCAVRVAQVDLGAVPLVTNGALIAADQSASIRSELGVLADGATIDGFLLPPTVPDTVKVTDPIAVSAIPDGAETAQVALSDNRLTPVWVGSFPRTRTSVTLPALPTGVKLAGTPANGVVVALGDVIKIADGGPYFKKAAYSRPFSVTR